MKIYKMVIGKECNERLGDKSTRKVYESKKQGSAPHGWVCVGVCGYYETVGDRKE